MAEDFWTNHFMDWCLKLDFEMEAVMAILIRCTRICRRWQSNWLSRVPPPSLLSTPLPCIVLFDHHDKQTNKPCSRKQQH